jgi:hypothetical protein
MKKFTLLLAGLAIAATFPSNDLFARGGGGRGGGGGGAARGGGFSGGGRPAMSAPMNHSPSMSRAAPSQMQRPAMNGQRPAAGGARPNLGGSNVAGQNLGGQGMSGRSTFQSPQSFQRPSANQMNSFLNLPQQSNLSGMTRNATPPAASTLPSGGGTKSYTTKGGATVTVGGKGGSTTTGSGATIAGGAAGIKVEGPGGNTYAKGKAGVGVTDGTNSAVRGGSVTAAKGANGNAAINARGGFADSSGYRQGGSVTAVKGAGGYTAVNARGGYGINGAGRVGSVSGIRGPAGNTITAGRGASFVHGQFVGGHAWQSVNGNFHHWNCFTPGWYGRYPGAWWPGRWAVATTAWATATWALAGSYCGCSGSGAYYDYGSNVTYQDGNVYNDDQPVASAEQYYNQATNLADAGQNPDNEDWMPLGVFAIAAEGQTNADKIVQLALNKEGVIRGNYQDVLTDKITPISGSVDKETQRVAMKLEGNDEVVLDTGLYNLTNDEVPVLIHFGPDRQESRTLVRLTKPEEQDQK